MMDDNAVWLSSNGEIWGVGAVVPAPQLPARDSAIALLPFMLPVIAAISDDRQMHAQSGTVLWELGHTGSWQEVVLLVNRRVHMLMCMYICTAGYHLVSHVQCSVLLCMWSCSATARRRGRWQ